jgi:hypothetical protein
MGADSTVLGVVIAVVGALASILVAWVARPRGTSAPVELPPGDGLTISPEIWRSLNGRIEQLETTVKTLAEEDSRNKERVTFLERLLRTAMRIIRAQSRTLRRADLPDEQIPARLIPYSID